MLTSTPMSSICHMSIEMNDGMEVHVGETKLCIFENNPKTIGARNLNGHTIVMIVSSLGAIVTNIAAARDSSLSRDVEDGTLHAREQMQHVLNCYRQYKDRLFGTGIEVACIVYTSVYRSPSAVSRDGLSVSLPHQMAGIASELAKIELEPQFKFYMFTELRRSSRSRGTVHVDARGFIVTVYLDDKPTCCIETARAAADRLRP
jgi:hypothetical protein